MQSILEVTHQRKCVSKGTSLREDAMCGLEKSEQFRFTL